MADDIDMSDEDDAEALRARRADLHAFMQEITVAALMLPLPETYLEAERAVRAITTADRLIQSFDMFRPDETPDETVESPAANTPRPRPTLIAMRKALRQLADRMMAAAKTIPMPDTALTALRALRYAQACDRMLTQLYATPKPAPAPPPKPRSPDEIRRESEQLRRELWERFSSHPKAKAIREARKLAAQSAAQTKTPEPPNPDTKTTEPLAAETATLNLRPETSQGQDENKSGQRPDRHDPP